MGIDPPAVRITVQVVLAIPEDCEGKLSMIVSGNPKLPHLAERGFAVKRNRKLTRFHADVELKTDPPKAWVVSPDQAALSSFLLRSLTTPRLPALAGRRPAWRLSLSR